MTALAVRGLDVALGGSPVLRGVSVEVASGEALALLGPSGSGKSTLLSAIGGFVVPTAGEIEIGGRMVSGPATHEPPERRGVGFVFQNYALWPHLSALRTVAYPLEREGASPESARAEAARLLETVGIGDLGHRRPAELSGGQQQRVGVARALARRASLYLLDEPTAHLDSALRSGLQRELAGRMTADGAAAVYSTHDAVEAMAVADRVALMRDGSIVQVGSPAGVYEHPVDLWAARLTGPAWEIDGAAAGVAEGPILVRPEWVEPGAGLAATVAGAWFRGAFTEVRLDTPAGTLEMRLPGRPAAAPGEEMPVRVTRWQAVSPAG